MVLKKPSGNGEVVKETPKELLRPIRKKLNIPKAPSLLPEPKKPKPGSGERKCPSCLGFGTVSRYHLGKHKKQSFKMRTPREVRRNADIIRALVPGGKATKVREVKVFSLPWDHKFGVQLWLELATHGLDPRELAYSRFPSHEQLETKKDYLYQLRRLIKLGLPKWEANKEAWKVWQGVQPCNPDGSWNFQGAGCEILHKPTGLKAAAVCQHFWQSRAKAERELAIKLKRIEQIPQPTTRLHVDQSSTMKRAFTTLITPWQTEPDYPNWPFDWWPVQIKRK